MGLILRSPISHNKQCLLIIWTDSDPEKGVPSKKIAPSGKTSSYPNVYRIHSCKHARTHARTHTFSCEDTAFTNAQ